MTLGRHGNLAQGHLGSSEPVSPYGTAPHRMRLPSRTYPQVAGLLPLDPLLPVGFAPRNAALRFSQPAGWLRAAPPTRGGYTPPLDPPGWNHEPARGGSGFACRVGQFSLAVSNRRVAGSQECDGRVCGQHAHVVFTPRTLLERLCALIPFPRTQLLTYHGVLAPASSWRDEVVPSPPPRKSAACQAPESADPVALDRRYRWAELMKRTFGFELLTSRVRRPARGDRLHHRAGGGAHDPAPPGPSRRAAQLDPRGRPAAARSVSYRQS